MKVGALRISSYAVIAAAAEADPRREESKGRTHPKKETPNDRPAESTRPRGPRKQGYA